MGDEIIIIPKGWSSVEELRDNLVEYLIEKSSYSELSGEDMPADMLREMSKSMESFALAIYHGEGSEEGEDPQNNQWILKVENIVLPEVGEDYDTLQLISGGDIIITQALIGKTVQIKISTKFHTEIGRIEDLQSHEIEVIFNESFEVIPIGSEPRVYRIDTVAPGKYRRTNIMFYFPEEEWLTNTGFKLTIEGFEELEGIIIEYEYK